MPRLKSGQLRKRRERGLGQQQCPHCRLLVASRHYLEHLRYCGNGGQRFTETNFDQNLKNVGQHFKHFVPMVSNLGGHFEHLGQNLEHNYEL